MKKEFQYDFPLLSACVKKILIKFFLITIFSFFIQIQVIGQARIDKYEPIHRAANDSDKQSTLTLLKFWNDLYEVDKISLFNAFQIGEWAKVFESKYQIAQLRNDTDLIFKISYPLGWIYHNMANYTQATKKLEYLHQRKKKLTKNEYSQVLIKLEENYRFFGNITAAVKLRNERIEQKFTNTFWELYQDIGLSGEALKDYKQFQPQPKEVGLTWLRYYFILGGLFIDNNQPDSAEKYYQIGFKECLRSTKIVVDKNEKERFRVYGGMFSGGIGIARILNSDFENAIRYLKYQESARALDLINNIASDRVCSIRLTECYTALTQKDSATYYFRKYQYYRQNITIDSLGTSEIISKYYDLLQKKDSALYYMNIHNICLKDRIKKQKEQQSIFYLLSLDNEKRRSELSISKLELEQSALKLKQEKEKQLLLFVILAAISLLSIILIYSIRNKIKSRKILEQKNDQLSQQKDKIEKQSAYTEVLLKELTHRVKNNLQVISSIMNMQQRRNNNEETAAHLEMIQSRVQMIAYVHENLSNIGNIDSVEIDHYINNITNYFKNIYSVQNNHVTIETDLAKIYLPIDKVVPIGLIINEAVSNSFKYAFPYNRPGNITISLKQIDQNYLLTIKDTGIGFEESSIKKTSLGFTLIKIFSDKLKADFSFNNKNGTEYTFKFNAD